MQARLSRCVLILCLSSAPALAQETASTIAPDVGNRVLEGYVTPTLARFREASGALSNALGDVCGASSDSGLVAVHQRFSETVSAWGHVSVLRFGPLVAENRFERIFFWPDPRGVTLRQVQGLLASDEALPQDLAAQSVALQGLPVLDYVLFGTGGDKLAEDARRCAYAQAVADNVADIAGALENGWAEGTAFQASFTAPAPDRDPYRSSAEVAGEVVKAAGTAIEFARNAELLPALGKSVEKARGKRAPFWRSGETFAFTAAQIEGVQQLITAAGFVDGPSDLVNGYGESMNFDLAHARDALEAVTGAPEAAFGEEEDRGRISYATIAMEGAKHTLNGELAGALGLVMGFNALDGD
ncbi:imelysin family protein [Nitratireductor aquimarinus]|uniref:imelysin family protein n=1 Tax=Nitratireductor aquimarinus TaxID=889300 RepID=UPI001A8C8F33|nr:imelysin family protein [Nitratireductor aquimarinus]MBN8241928.1 imelysin family protein [Nitratireductor aquimarinus]MBY6130314.1 imelysin family protein [Nitratireductor aquimarinus]